MEDYSDHIAIIGAGIAGLTLGIMLNKNNIPNVIFERSSHVSENGAGISISPNGKFVLAKLDLLEDLQKISANCKKTIFYSNLNEITNIKTEVLTTSRKSLYDVLFTRYKRQGGEIKFDHELEEIDLIKKQISFKDGNSCVVNHIAACDGINSKCHSSISSLNAKTKYSGYSVWRSIFKSKQDSINFHLGSDFHVVSYPVGENKVSLIAAVKDNDKIVESWKERGSLDDLLREVPSSIIKKYPSIKDSEGIYKWGVYIRPQIEFMYKKNITYLGDAAHPIVPFIGQGACMALEDSYALGYLINKHNNLGDAQIHYQKLRLKRVRSIHRKSLNQARLNHIKNPFFVAIRNFLMKHTNIIHNRTKSIWSYDVISKLGQ